MLNPYIIIFALLMALGSGLVGYRQGIASERASQIDQRELLAAVADEAANTAAKAIAQLKPKYTTISNQLEKQIETHTVFRDCRIDPVSLQLANQALTGGGAVAPGDSKLPGAHASE